jgi:hypothetical protein
MYVLSPTYELHISLISCRVREKAQHIALIRESAKNTIYIERLERVIQRIL